MLEGDVLWESSKRALLQALSLELVVPEVTFGAVEIVSSAALLAGINTWLADVDVGVSASGAASETHSVGEVSLA